MATYGSVVVEKLRRPAHRLRESLDPDRLAELADSMATEGLKQPIGVRGPLDGDEYEVIWGDRRAQAAASLGWDTIPAMIHPADADPFLAAVHENLIREDLTPLEEAHICATLAERELTEYQIARLLRRSPEWVRGRLTILRAPEDVQLAIHEKKIPLGVAYALAAIDHAGYRADLIEQAIRLGVTVAVAQVWVAEYARDRDLLIRSHEGVAEIIRRAHERQAVTDCQACRAETAWVSIRTLRLCPRCHDTIEDELAQAAAAPPPADPL